MSVEFYCRTDLDRSLTRSQWKTIDRFRRIQNRIVQNAWKQFDHNGFARDVLLYGSATMKVIDGIPTHIPYKELFAGAEK